MGSTLPVAIFFSGSPLKWSAKLSFQMVIKGSGFATATPGQGWDPSSCLSGRSSIVGAKTEVFLTKAIDEG
jgi:hypothetical protein